MWPLSTGDYKRYAQYRDGDQRFCKVCEQWQNQANFYRKAGYTCKPCRNAQIVQQRRESGMAWEHKLWVRYKLRAADYRRMQVQQQHKCALCQRRAAQCVDHDHVTDRVRALLCHACNSALGKLGDDPALLRKAARYVEQHKNQ